MTSELLTDDDIEILWQKYSNNGKITDEGFRALIHKYFYNREEGLHKRVLDQRRRIQDKLFGMIYSHPSGEDFVTSMFRVLGREYGCERAFRDLEHTIFGRDTPDKELDTE